jgi:hypothetical protein
MYCSQLKRTAVFATLILRNYIPFHVQSKSKVNFQWRWTSTGAPKVRVGADEMQHPSPQSKIQRTHFCIHDSTKVLRDVYLSLNQPLISANN